MYLVLDLANMENGGRALLRRSEEMLPDDCETGDHTTLAVLSSKDIQRSRSVVVTKSLLNAVLSECVVLYFSVLTEGIIHIHRNAGSKLIAKTIKASVTTNSIQIMNVYECNGKNIFMK